MELYFIIIAALLTYQTIVMIVMYFLTPYIITAFMARSLEVAATIDEQHAGFPMTDPRA